MAIEYVVVSVPLNGFESYGHLTVVVALVLKNIRGQRRELREIENTRRTKRGRRGIMSLPTEARSTVIIRDVGKMLVRRLMMAAD